MKKYKETYIIGVDHGYGNMKTANCCFQTGVTVYEKEPIFKDNLLVWNNKYYLIGAEHKEFSADKMLDEDYYILTLAAIARVNIPWWRSHPIHENRATESICTEPCNPLLRATKSTKRATSNHEMILFCII